MTICVVSELIRCFLKITASNKKVKGDPFNKFSDASLTDSLLIKSVILFSSVMHIEKGTNSTLNIRHFYKLKLPLSCLMKKRNCGSNNKHR